MRDIPWLWPEWFPDTSGAAKKVEIPEAGGWMYQFRAGDGIYSNVFVPNVSIWAAAIANAIAADLDPKSKSPVAVVLDLGRVSHTKQPRPGGGG